MEGLGPNPPLSTSLYFVAIDLLLQIRKQESDEHEEDRANDEEKVRRHWIHRLLFCRWRVWQDANGEPGGFLVLGSLVQGNGKRCAKYKQAADCKEMLARKASNTSVRQSEDRDTKRHCKCKAALK
jgi:hypothetical protein